jgi:nucleoside-diphosphate-sugar epimerase
MKSVLVTGATGFIGYNLITRLMELGYDISILDLKSVGDLEATMLKPYKNKIKRIFWEDIAGEEIRTEDNERLGKIDCCIHLASYGVNPKDKDLDKIIDGNIKLLQKILEFCKKIGVDKLVNTGSGFEYGNQGSKKITEENLPNPEGIYGAAKTSALLFGKIKAKELGIDMVTLRPFNIFGIGESPNRLLPFVFDRLENEQEIDLTPGEQIRDYLYVKDVVEAYVKILECQLFDNGVYNVCSGRGISVKDLLLEAADAVGIDKSLLKFGARKYRENEAMFIVGDNSKLVENTGWSPRYSLREGMLEMYESFKRK